MNHRLVHSVLLCFLIMSLGGCGDDDSGNTTPTDGAVGDGTMGMDAGLDPWSLERRCESQAEALCEAQYRCRIVKSLPACIAEAQAQCMRQAPTRADGITNARIMYNMDKNRSCYEALASADCYDVARNPQAHPDCAEAWVGLVAMSAPCLDSEECMAGYCSRVNAGCPGACLPYATESLGCTAPLVAGDTRCMDGLRCDSATSTCARLKAVGEACGTNAECATPLKCVMQTAGMQCTMFEGDRGAECANISECLWPLTCVGFMCSYNAPQDQPCREDINCLPGTACVDHDSLSNTPMKCLARVDVGEECFGQHCIEGAYCRVGRNDKGICTVLPAVGDTCDTLCVEGAWCRELDEGGGVCTALSALNEACGECQPGLYCEPTMSVCADLATLPYQTCGL